MKSALLFAFAIAALSSGAQAQSPSCTTGPLQRDIGGMPWQIYACDDQKSVKLDAAPGSKAAGATFTFVWDKNGGYTLHGSPGTDASASDRAFQALGQLNAGDIMGLYHDATNYQK